MGGSLWYGAAAAPRILPQHGGGLSGGEPATDSTLSAISTVPGRPATNLQASRAEEKREADRAQLAERLREAIQKDKELKEREEISRELLAADGKQGAARQRQ